MPDVRIYKAVGTDRSRVEDETRTPRCGMAESKKRYAQMSHASKTRKCQISDSMQLLAQIDAARGQDPLEDASLERPRMQSFNRSFCQITFGEHNV